MTRVTLYNMKGTFQLYSKYPGSQVKTEQLIIGIMQAARKQNPLVITPVKDYEGTCDARFASAS